MKFLLDTQAIISALDPGFDISKLSVRPDVFVTQVQVDELRASHEGERVELLLATLHTLSVEAIPTSAAASDIPASGEADFSDPVGLYASLRNVLDTKSPHATSNARDAWIGAIALSRNMILVTDDDDLGMSLLEHGGASIVFADFTKRL